MPKRNPKKPRRGPGLRRQARAGAARVRPVDVTLVTEWRDGAVARFDDYLVGEEPLEIRIGKRRISVTMRTPGHDLELAAGFLFSEGVVNDGGQIAGLRQASTRGRARNVVRVDLRDGTDIANGRLQRNFTISSSCGLCGKTSIDAVRVRGITRPNPDLRVAPEVLTLLPDALRSAQPLFGRTGGPHAAALFDSRGVLVVLREDVGRHNAVDKLIGWALLEKRLPLRESVLLVSGRGSFEIVQKALVAGIPVVACISAPSSLAVQLAWEFGLTLIGFLRGTRFVLYAGEERLQLGRDRSA